jgi:hypothetical protein
MAGNNTTAGRGPRWREPREEPREVTQGLHNESA